jgi:AraC-like DNA-binding protein
MLLPHYDTYLSPAVRSFEKLAHAARFAEPKRVAAEIHLLHEGAMAIAQLLANRSLSISDVAAAVGYNSASQFSALFVRMTGLSPGTYRRKMIKNLLRDIISVPAASASYGRLDRPLGAGSRGFQQTHIRGLIPVSLKERLGEANESSVAALAAPRHSAGAGR